MTYEELLRETAKKKQSAINEINNALNGECGWLMKHELKNNAGRIAWLYLAKEFCETLAEHVGEFIEQTGDVYSIDAKEIGDIYMAYEDDDPNLYDLLPTEARLFD